MEPVRYTVDVREPHGHLIGVEARFPSGGAHVDLRLPVWTPGSYLVREYQRHVQDFAAFAPDGRPLPVVKLDKSTWRVDAREAQAVVVRYRVYAWELTVRTAHFDDTHAFLNGACLFVYHDALVGRPAHVHVLAPAAWHVATALDVHGGAYVAANYDELVDSPFHIGTHELVEFTAQGRPHAIAIWGRAPIDRAQLVADVTKIIDAAAALFGGVPYDRYTFLLLSAPNAYGGLEHASSSTLLTTPSSFAPRKKYQEFLELVSHEFFHLWNVKRIRPAALGPFDYQREAYTRSLWVMEGITSYYDRLFLVRAGLMTAREYLDKLGEELGKIAATPGRAHVTLEEASFDAWIKHYRPDENSVNSTISYYLKGGAVALLLDLEIRARSRGARSLDDVMRVLWRDFGARGVGFADDEFARVVEDAAGVPLDDFFARYVRGRDELDARATLGAVGLAVKESWDGVGEGDPAPGWLGATVKDDGVIAASLAGGPAERAGLYALDEIVALDGLRADAAAVKEQLALRKPGERVTFTVFRRDELRTVEVTLGEHPRDKLQLAAVADPTDAQRAAYQAWLGEELTP
jgi:predicted metalloprotease with PDZ domain